MQLLAPIIAALGGAFAGSRLAPKPKALPPPPSPPDAPIRPAQTAARERARRAMPKRGGGIAGLVLPRLGGSGGGGGGVGEPQRKSLLGR